MRKKEPSDTYKLLYNHNIVATLYEICNNNKNYCVKHKINNKILPIAIWEKYEEFQENTSNNMAGSRLDRHKLASCLCGAIIEVRPLVGINGAKIAKNANEILALTVALSVIKSFMIYDKMNELQNESKRIDFFNYMKEKFDLNFPSVECNICDSQEYKKNMLNALYWCHQKCKITNKECFSYDVWAYAKIFYHLEVHNKQTFTKYVNQYAKRQPIN